MTLSTSLEKTIYWTRSSFPLDLDNLFLNTSSHASFISFKVTTTTIESKIQLFLNLFLLGRRRYNLKCRIRSVKRKRLIWFWGNELLFPWKLFNPWLTLVSYRSHLIESYRFIHIDSFSKKEDNENLIRNKEKRQRDGTH